MKSLNDDQLIIDFLTTLLKELGGECNVDVSRDISTLVRRFEHEGMSFITITLPSLGKVFDLSLEMGEWQRLDAKAFSHRGGLPEFLQGFLCQVFDRFGLIRPSVPTSVVRNVRQFLHACGKLLLPCDPVRENRALRAYIETDKEVANHDASRDDRDYRDLRRTFVWLFGHVLGRLEHRIAASQLHPRHGPGATADGLKGQSKYRFDYWYSRWDGVFDAVDYAVPSYRYWREALALNHILPHEERPVKVILVPKTQKAPRVIAEEPTVMMYMQQALKDELYDLIESDSFLSNILGFRDQSRNQKLAYLGSVSGELATLDLSEASDRVSNHLVKELFGCFPLVSEALQLARTGTALVKDETIVLNKYASMGSALCFPVEAMVFTTIVIHSVLNQLNLNRRQVRKSNFIGLVSVYGDDIIVPTPLRNGVESALTLYGLKVNQEKSFSKGAFRESCGKDYFSGEDVTPVRVRRMMPTSRRQVQDIVSLSSLRNQLYSVGLWKTAQWCDNRVKSLLGLYPIIPREAAAVGRHSFLPVVPSRYNTRLHRDEVQVWTPVAKPPVDTLDDLPALHKVLSVPFTEYSERLDRAGRPDAVRMKRQWIPAE